MARTPVRKKIREKKRSWSRVSQAQEGRHWLGEGSLSEAALLAELDPVLYAIDDTLHRYTNSVAHSYDGNEKRPFALLLPIPETIGWQIGYLSKHFNTYVLSDEELDGIDEASDYFQIRAIDFDEFEELDHWIDLFLATSYVWSSAKEFYYFMNNNLPLLSPEGSAYAVLRGRAPLTLCNDSEMEIEWHDGSTSTLAELFSYHWYKGSVPEVARSICFPALNPRDPNRLSLFSKRNRRFFGKDAQPLLLQILDREDEFSNVFELPENGDISEWAVILRWKSPAEY